MGVVSIVKYIKENYSPSLKISLIHKVKVLKFRNLTHHTKYEP